MSTARGLRIRFDTCRQYVILCEREGRTGGSRTSAKKNTRRVPMYEYDLFSPVRFFR